MTPTTTARRPSSWSATSAASPASPSPMPPTRPPAPVLDVVQRDGLPIAHDPRVGMVGGSYGGQVQFAAASIDKRIDTIVPLITWNDLSYSFAPNNTSQLKPALDGVSTSTPGAGKAIWAFGFFGLGVENGVQNAPTDPRTPARLPQLPDVRVPDTRVRRHDGHPDDVPDQPATTRIRDQLHEQGQGADPHRPGPDRHAVQPQRGRRELPRAESPGHADQDDLDERRPLRSVRARRARDRQPGSGRAVRDEPHRRLARPLPQGRRHRHRARVLVLPRLGVLHRHRHPRVRGQRDLSGRHTDAVLPVGLEADHRPVADRQRQADLCHAAWRPAVVLRRARRRPLPAAPAGPAA